MEVASSLLGSLEVVMPKQTWNDHKWQRGKLSFPKPGPQHPAAMRGWRADICNSLWVMFQDLGQAGRLWNQGALSISLTWPHRAPSVRLSPWGYGSLAPSPAASSLL